MFSVWVASPVQGSVGWLVGGWVGLGGRVGSGWVGLGWLAGFVGWLVG